MFRYEYMVIAFAAALLLGIAFPLIGGTAVYKRLSSSGDALAHSALAGVAIALVAGLSPMLFSIIACVISFLLIDVLRHKFGKYAEIGVVVVLSAAIAIAGIASGYINGVSFESYLFGSILLISKEELYIVIGLVAAVVIFFLLTYFVFFHSLYSEDEAKINKIPVRYLDLIHSVLFALTVAIGAKVVGSLVVSSMLILPTAAALLWKKGYRLTAVFSLGYSIISMIGGIILSYYLDWKPGATSVGLAVSFLLLTLAIVGIRKLIKKKPTKQPTP